MWKVSLFLRVNILNICGFFSFNHSHLLLITSYLPTAVVHVEAVEKVGPLKDVVHHVGPAEDVEHVKDVVHAEHVVQDVMHAEHMEHVEHVEDVGVVADVEGEY